MRHDILNPVDNCVCFNCGEFRRSIWSHDGPDCGCEQIPFYSKEMCDQCRYKTKCEIALHPEWYRMCRVCGCTDDIFFECVQVEGKPCYWVEPDLCSRCANAKAKSESGKSLSEPLFFSYDPEFSTTSNRVDVIQVIEEMVAGIGKLLGPELKNIVGVAQGETGPMFEVKLTEGDIRLIRFLSQQDTGGDRMTGAERIAAERTRQIEEEGWTAEHDDQHTNGELALAACCFATPIRLYAQYYGPGTVCFYDPWPDWWDDGWDKRLRYGERRDNPNNMVPDPDTYSFEERLDLLVKAGALIAAEIDRSVREEEKERRSENAGPV